MTEPGHWKQVYVPVDEGCMHCAQSVCDDCAPAGQPAPGDRIFVPPHEVEMLEALDKAFAKLDEAFEALDQARQLVKERYQDLLAGTGAPEGGLQ